DGDAYLHRPTPIVAAGRGLPLAVPVLVDALAARVDERVDARAARVDLEHVAGAAVLEGVDEEQHVVLGVEVSIALLGEGHDPRGVRVLARDAEPELLWPRQGLHDRAAGGAVALTRLDHGEVGRGRRRGPVGLVEQAVDPAGAREDTRLQPRPLRLF